MAPSLLASAASQILAAPRRGGRGRRRLVIACSAGAGAPPKLVTFLGKGGSGKTTAAAVAAQYYASEGLKTCLVIQSQDPTAEQLMGCKIGNSLTECAANLSTMKLETSKMLLEPLDRLKKVDSQINLTQGVLEAVVGEELGVLPGMDSVCSVLALQKLLNFFSTQRNSSQEEFDVVVYDCNNTEEILRLIGATERARSYLRYVKDLAEKTDIGRLASPSAMRLIYDSARPNGKTSEGRLSSELWNDIEQLIQRISVWFADPSKFACFLIMDPRRSISVSSALRYWGCTTQAGGNICGAFGYTEQPFEIHQGVAEKFLPMTFSFLPFLPTDSSADWSRVLNSLSQNAKDLLRNTSNKVYPSVSFDSVQKSVTLFMPGFDKSEIKLYQYRGGSELLIEAGDQRRVVKLPPAMQGKVGGAKFVDRNLIVTIR
uniref:Anion-transporting ATPase-like domain-containing protein n=1 Tax=Oryza glumipatula TaxID=40148 RepID=A0A0D9YX97_9ORYZ